MEQLVKNLLNAIENNIEISKVGNKEKQILRIENIAAELKALNQFMLFYNDIIPDKIRHNAKNL